MTKASFPSSDGTAKLGDRSLFPELDSYCYLSHAAISPPSTPVQAAVRAVLDSYAREGQAAFVTWAGQRERLRLKLATFLGTQADNLALLSGTTRALNDLALAFPWRSGDSVVLFEGEFPANITPWQQAARLFQLTPRFISLLGAEQDSDKVLGPLEDSLKLGVRVVAVSAVQFQTGLRMPLAEMSELCHRYGAEIAVDAIQAVGVTPLDVDALQLDYVAGGAHKWLMGIEGAGYLYVRPERVRALVPKTAGWLSHENPLEFLLMGPGRLDYQRPLVASPRVFEGGSGSVVSAAALEAALDVLIELGVQPVFDHVSRYLDSLQEGLEQRGLGHHRAKARAARSGILSMRVPLGYQLQDLAHGLRARGVQCSTPDGLLRFSPHFPNALAEVDIVLSALDETMIAARERS